VGGIRVNGWRGSKGVVRALALSSGKRNYLLEDMIVKDLVKNVEELKRLSKELKARLSILQLALEMVSTAYDGVNDLHAFLAYIEDKGFRAHAKDKMNLDVFIPVANRTAAGLKNALFHMTAAIKDAQELSESYMRLLMQVLEAAKKEEKGGN
jgi:hypothetical protein